MKNGGIEELKELMGMTLSSETEMFLMVLMIRQNCFSRIILRGGEEGDEITRTGKRGPMGGTGKGGGMVERIGKGELI